MATVDFYIWKRPTKDGRFPISVRITIDRKPSYIMTGHKLDSLDQWDAKTQRVKKSHPNSVRLNNYLLSELTKASDKVLELKTSGPTSAKEVKDGLKPVDEKHTYFSAVATQFLEDQKALGNYECYKTQKGHLKRFYAFANNCNIPFKDITVDLLQRYLIFLKQSNRFRYNENSSVKPLSSRTIANHMITLRTIYNRAISAKLASQEDYPFGAKGKVPINLTGLAKMGLDQSEIKKLEEIDLFQKSEIYNQPRNI